MATMDYSCNPRQGIGSHCLNHKVTPNYYPTLGSETRGLVPQTLDMLVTRKSELEVIRPTRLKPILHTHNADLVMVDYRSLRQLTGPSSQWRQQRILFNQRSLV